MFSSFAETAADPLSVPVLLFLLLPSLDTLSKVYFQAVKNLVSANVLGESASSPLAFSFCSLSFLFGPPLEAATCTILY